MPTAAVLAGVVSPTAKVSHLGSTAVTVALASVPAVVIVVRDGVELGVAMVLLVLGPAPAWPGRWTTLPGTSWPRRR